MRILLPIKERTQPLDLFVPFNGIGYVLKDGPKIDGNGSFFRLRKGGD
jgi:hypothetical protein